MPPLLSRTDRERDNMAKSPQFRATYNQCSGETEGQLRVQEVWSCSVSLLGALETSVESPVERSRVLPSRWDLLLGLYLRVAHVVMAWLEQHAQKSPQHIV